MKRKEKIEQLHLNLVNEARGHSAGVNAIVKINRYSHLLLLLFIHFGK